MKTATTATPLMPDSPTNFSADLLWQRLDAYNLDDADVPFPFSAKLAKENNWDTSFAQAAILEYKRFVYLCCTLPQGASPPPIIDEVWHLHLCYTVNYWEVFCEIVLQRKLHHHPNKGGPAENDRHHNWLDDTLANYHNIFGTEPPATIWHPDVKVPTAIKRTSNKKRIILIAAVVACLVLSGCSASTYASVLGVIGFSAIVIAGIAAEPPGTVSNNKKSKSSISGCGGDGGGGGSDGDGGGDGGGGCSGGCGGCGGGGD